MATLTAQTKLTCSGINSDDMALDVTMTPTVAAGGIISKTIDVRSGAAVEILYETHYDAGAIIYLKNTSSSETAYIETNGGHASIVLSAGQWAVFPWNAVSHDLKAYSSASLVLEIGVFSAT
jgi:hypothetical protein|tara:strand:- start:1124 stop:1489 length:366 start_codon:yes stop_codon:yes gene_type:complete